MAVDLRNRTLGAYAKKTCNASQRRRGIYFGYNDLWLFLYARQCILAVYFGSLMKKIKTYVISLYSEMNVGLFCIEKVAESQNRKSLWGNDLRNLQNILEKRGPIGHHEGADGAQAAPKTDRDLQNQSS